MQLKLNDIHKSFGNIRALKGVELTISPGEIHGLLGENGAGKTTLMNILAGTFPPDSGTITIDGNRIVHMTPRKAMEMKIRFIHQELNLCNDLKVYQNLFLGEELVTHAYTVDTAREIQKAQEILERMHTGIDAQAVVGTLETAEKQLVEIARALLFKSELIIMDEPTTALNNKEIENLFRIMRELKTHGVSFIYISHKMPEIFQICDTYTVLRDGNFIETGLIGNINTNRATELLIGHSLVAQDESSVRQCQATDKVVMQVDAFSGKGFSDITFSLHEGEVMVITGLQGSGAAELAMALFGAEETTGGNVTVNGRKLKENSIRDAMAHGMGMIPRNRKERGILPDLSVVDNMSLAYFTTKHHKLFIDKDEEHERFERNRKRMSIKVGRYDDPITSLSGGNQQKVIFGKWFELDASVMIMDNPTQGIDVGAKFSIYSIINDLAQSKKSLLVFSNEYPEIHRIADSVLVLYKGRIAGRLNRNELDEKLIMAYSTGLRGEV